MNTNQWAYISGKYGDECSAQISPDGNTVLLKESERTKEGIKYTYRMLDIKESGGIVEHYLSLPIINANKQ